MPGGITRLLELLHSVEETGQEYGAISGSGPVFYNNNKIENLCLSVLFSLLSDWMHSLWRCSS